LGRRVSQYRLNFYFLGENYIPEEYLHEFAIASGYVKPKTGEESAASSSSNPIVDTVAAFMESAAWCGNGPDSIYQAEVFTRFCKHPKSDLV
jgi:hypothetical protein